MATPPRMVSLECPQCYHHHWVIDHDFRGPLAPKLSHEERTYECPACREASTGYRVLERSPSEFFLQPHSMYPMTTREFARWLAVFRAQFPGDARLRSVGVTWYPGRGDDRQERKIDEARQIDSVHGYHLSLSNNSPDDERIRVCVQTANGEAYFWCGSKVELDRCYFGFAEAEVETIRAILASRASDVRRAWQRFSKEATKARERWMPELSSNER